MMEIGITSGKVIDVEFKDITYTVKEKGTKHIINGVSGKFLSGELSAIMGPSGAGKTSLLNILTGYQVSGTRGTIQCNSPNWTNGGSMQYKKQSCYILQDDSLPSFLTVQEAMMMCCDLKIANLPDKSKQYLVDSILSNLGLEKCKNTRCQNLSGGQKKRVSIALELVDNPAIMFLDEPTSGLDSSSATQCVQVLKKLARGGRTIVCTIHQPNASLYELFDHVFVVASGRCVYQGATTSTVEYLSSFGLQCPKYHNPADYLLEVVSGEYGNYVDVMANSANDEKWRGPLPPFRLHLTNDVPSSPTIYSANDSQYGVPSEWRKFIILLQRNARDFRRDRSIIYLKIFLILLVGVGIGLTYQDCGNNASKAIFNLGFLLAGLVFLAFVAIMPAVLKFPSELVMLKKENFNHWYDLKTYFAAFLTFDIPFQILFSMVYCSSSYFLSDQPIEFRRFWMVLLIQSLTCLASSSLGLILGSILNPINGTFVGSILLAVMIALGGLMLLYTHMSSMSYLLTYISFISFGVEAVMQALYGYSRGPLHCSETEEYCRYISPELLLQDVGMDKPNYWIDVAYLTVTFVAFRTVAFCTLKRKVRAK
ncbi:hypothetical protein JTB14_034542 [Gonioctena quinquepunctata]|nr:hypothetical protein JTB14_034542 [Gonioctena quinquepunctata]